MSQKNEALGLAMDRSFKPKECSKHYTGFKVFNGDVVGQTRNSIFKGWPKERKSTRLIGFIHAPLPKYQEETLPVKPKPIAWVDGVFIY
jgi:hypothetical protein